MKLIFNYLMFVLMMVYVQTGMADVADKVSMIADKIPAATGQHIVIAAAIIEFLLRFVKTKKPMSIVRLVSKTLRVVAEGVIKLVDFIDAIMPQRVEGQPLVSLKLK